MPKRPLNPESLAGTTPEPTVAAGPPSAAIASDPPGHPSGLAIIASKIAPAVEGRTVLTRARLVGWLEQQRQARIVLVTAEAGYGKSTLLADFAHRTYG